MALDRKHFDDFDDFCDFNEKLDTCSEGDLGDNAPNQSLSWRRLIIEKAVNNVKKAVENKADLHVSYKKGELVFDEEANKFGRVMDSKPGLLSLSLLAGGTLIRRDINQLDFIRENRQRLTLKEIAATLGLSEIAVIAQLNNLELEAEEKAKALKDQSAQVKSAQKKQPKVAAKSLKQIKREKSLSKAKPNTKKSSIKLTPKSKDLTPKESSVSFTKLLPKGATTDPVMDPNGYIQQNFLMMSNKELAVATGLSEHTIRRKLGEWNLKRKDFVNKA